jgi:non-ribosomal peptide synthase protein (TIGR01720 family)
LNANGKVDRNQLPDPAAVARTEGDVSVEVGYAAPRSEAEKLLCEVWQQILKVPRVGTKDNFFELGGDSIISIQVVSAARQRGLEVSVKQIFEQPTVGELAQVATQRSTEKSATAEQGMVRGEIGLTPVHNWFFEQSFAAPNHFNQAQLLEINLTATRADKSSVSLEEIREVVAALMRHHDILRMRVVHTADKLIESIDGDDVRSEAVPVEQIVLTATTSDIDENHVLKNIAEEAQHCLDIERGMMLRVVHIISQGKKDRLLVVIHHLAVDGVSWRVLVEDIGLALKQVVTGAVVSLPPKTTSFKSWSSKLASYANSEKALSELPYWTATLSQELKSLRRFPGTPNVPFAEMSLAHCSLPADQTEKLLTQVCGLYRAQINDVLLTALTMSFAETTNSDGLSFTLEGHGREEIINDVDISRTVGWFTSMFPVSLSMKGVEWQTDVGAALKSIKEQLRRIPSRGVGYGILKFLNASARSKLFELSSQEQIASEVSFNYLGQMDAGQGQEGVVTSLPGPTGPAVSLKNKSHRLIDINAIVSQGELQVEWAFASQALRSDVDVSAIAAKFIEVLNQFVALSTDPAAGGSTPSDFPLVRGLTQKHLDAALGNARNVEDMYPLTALQEGLLFHALLDSHSQEYMTQMRWTITASRFEPELFKKCWSMLTQRHTIFRTQFQWEGLPNPVQVVVRNIDIDWEDLDWRSETNTVQKVSALMSTLRQSGFSLRTPGFNYKLIRTSEDHFDFIFTHHHIYLDGWSLALVLSELYTMYSTRADASVLQRANPFKNYVVAFAEYDKAAAEAYWKQYIKGFLAPTPLPNAITGKSASSGDAQQPLSHADVHLTGADARVIFDFAKAHQITVATLMQAAWSFLLSEYSRESDVAFGSVVSGRSLAGVRNIESIIGLCINTLPVRVSVESNRTIMSWLYQLQQRSVESNQYEFTPLAQIQGWSDVPRGSGLFDSLLVYENYTPPSSSPDSGLNIEDSESAERTNLPLTIAAIPAPDELILNAMFLADRFARGTVEQLLKQMKTLLLNMVRSAPSQALVASLNMTSYESVRVFCAAFRPSVYSRCVCRPARGHPPLECY